MIHTFSSQNNFWVVEVPFVVGLFHPYSESFERVLMIPILAHTTQTVNILIYKKFNSLLIQQNIKHIATSTGGISVADRIT